MKLILLSGGSGKRLWPMSNDSRSKQFLKVLTDDQGRSVSMLQRVWQQIDRVGLADSAYLCASKAQFEMIMAQLGQVPVIIEPDRRDTFPAIALGVTYLLDEINCDEDETVAILPVDHYVDDDYFTQIASLTATLDESSADVALLGVRPTEATSKFGYIGLYPSENGASARYQTVASFIEKPDVARARTLIEQGALWNCGVFCFRLGYLRSFLEQHHYPTTFATLMEEFHELPKRSFDYEVLEQALRLVAVPYEGRWQDLGTWSALMHEVGQDFVGMGHAVHCEGTHIVNELGIPVIAMGLKDAVVVATPDGILVSDLEQSASIKDAVVELAARPMYEERFWGSYRVLDYTTLDDGTEVLTKAITILPDKHISYQKHMLRTEVWTVIAGTGEFVIDTRVTTLAPGDVVRIFPDQWHAIKAIEQMQIIEVQRGAELIEEDIIRRYDAWDDILHHVMSLSL